MMATKTGNKRLDHILDCAKRQFRAPVTGVTAPGGKNRASYRLHMQDRTVIATLRPNFRRTHLEAHVLRCLSAVCTDTPRCLGVVGEVMFQSDVGEARLNSEIATRPHAEQVALATDAVRAIFRIHEAAHRTDLPKIMPHLGTNDAWIANLIAGHEVLAEFSDHGVAMLDLDRIAARLNVPATQFVKWDCRSGNAALDGSGKLRWFDFEYSGLRHGAEDLAWLVGDESWPLPADQMFAIIAANFDPECGHSPAAYFDYLALYSTFHVLQRFQLILKEARKRGWLTKAKVLKYDDAGVHPEYAARIARVGAWCADQTPLTRPLAPQFADAAQIFAELLDPGTQVAAQ